MSEHHASLTWNRDRDDFKYPTYTRDHTWSFQGGENVPASAAPEFLGNADRVDPEEAFVAAISACHMLTFLAVAAKRRFVVDSYSDSAVGYLEKNGDGNLAITRVELRPGIVFSGETRPTFEQIDSMHHRSHQECFIANSVSTEIVVLAPTTR
ncbi:MAG: OsmC family protein [Dehalococcoidia bacterium]|jgi:organic hydroperoxide reductase OsmC/OhrA|nr:OsmC family protein [Dehalococcoidia bacterium]